MTSDFEIGYNAFHNGLPPQSRNNAEQERGWLAAKAERRPLTEKQKIERYGDVNHGRVSDADREEANLVLRWLEAPLTLTDAETAQVKLVLKKYRGKGGRA